MTPDSPTLAAPMPGRLETPRAGGMARDLAAMEEDSHRPEVQEMIRRAIRSGSIRVRPRPDDPRQVEIVPQNPRGRPA